MPTKTHPLIKARRFRITRLNECGVPVEGPKSTLVSGGILSLAMTDELNEGEEINVVNGSGELESSDQAKPQLKFVSATLTFTKVNPDAFEMTTGSALVLDGDGNAVGNVTDRATYASANFTLELWTDLGKDGACPPSGREYGYMVLPWMASASFGEVTFENAAASFSVAGRTEHGNQWGAGPYNVVLNATDVPSPLLSPLPASAHRLLQFTGVAPPAVTDGAVPLDLTP